MRKLPFWFAVVSIFVSKTFSIKEECDEGTLRKQSMRPYIDRLRAAAEGEQSCDAKMLRDMVEKAIVTLNFTRRPKEADTVGIIHVAKFHSFIACM